MVVFGLAQTKSPKWCERKGVVERQHRDTTSSCVQEDQTLGFALLNLDWNFESGFFGFCWNCYSHCFLVMPLT